MYVLFLHKIGNFPEDQSSINSPDASESQPLLSIRLNKYLMKWITSAIKMCISHQSNNRSLYPHTFNRPLLPLSHRCAHPLPAPWHIPTCHTSWTTSVSARSQQVWNKGSFPTWLPPSTSHQLFRDPWPQLWTHRVRYICNSFLHSFTHHSFAII